MINIYRSIFLLALLIGLSAAEQQPQKFYKGDSVTVYAERERQIARSSSIALKMAIPNRAIPASVNVVTEAVLRDQHVQTLTDALSNVSGVQSQSGYGVHDYFIIRGFNSLDNGLILTDQTPEPEATIYDVYNLQRIEMMKGPGAFLYGSNPLSAAVNLVRKTPVFKNFLHTSSFYGRFQTMRQTIDAGWAEAIAKIALRLNGVWQRTDLYRDDKKSRIAAVNPALLWQPNDKQQLQLDLEYVDNRFKPDTGVPMLYNPVTQQLDQLPNIARATNFQSPQDISEQNLYRIKARYTHTWSRDRQMQIRIFHTTLDWFSKGTLVNGAYPTPYGFTMVSRTLPILKDRQQIYGMQWQWNDTYHTGSISHRLIFAADLIRATDHYRYDIIPQMPAVDLYHPSLAADQSADRPYPYLHGNATSATYAPYAADLIQFTSRWSALIGGRFDHILFQDPERQREQTFQSFSPMAGLMLAVTEQHNLYVHWGQAFAPPSTLAIGDLKPEKSRQMEGGLKSTLFNQNLELHIAYYNLNKFNIPVPDKSGISKQIGDQQSQGVEVELTIQPSRNWTTMVNYAYCDAKLKRFQESVLVGQDEYGQPLSMIFDRSGRRPAFAPTHIIDMWSTREWSFGLGLGMGVRYISEQHIDEDNAFLLPSYWVVDALIYFKQANWKWQINARNLNDAKYWLRGNGGYSVTPAAPVVWSTGVELTL